MGLLLGFAYMFEDLEEEDGAQKHFNAEVGLLWASDADYTVLLGYRYKEYSGDGASEVSFGGVTVSLSFRP